MAFHRHRQAPAAGLSALMCLLVALAACSPSGTRDPIVVTIWAVESADARAPLQFSVRAEPAPATDLTVSVTIAADGCDLTQSLESVTIAAAADQAVFTVLTTSLEAGADDGCTVTAAVAPGAGYAVGTSNIATVTVSDNDGPALPVVTLGVSGPTSIVEGETASWTLSAAPAPTTELTVNLNWTQSSDSSFLPGSRPQTVTIPVSGEATVSVDTVDDSTDGPSGTVTLSVVGGGGYAVGTSNSATVTVSDNDGPALPVVTLGVSGPTSIVEGETASWTLSAAPAPTSELTVNLNWTQSSGSSFLPGSRPQTVTIPVSGEATVSVDTVDDSTDEPSGTVTLSVVGGGGYAVGTSNTATVTVSDNDGPALPVVTLGASGPTSIVEGETASWTLSAAPAPTTELTVNLNWTQSSDSSFLPGSRPQTVTIPVSGEATVSVDTVDDSTDEPNGTVTLSVVGGSGYAVGTSNTAVIAVSDNDPAGPRVATIEATQTEVTEGEVIRVGIRISRAFSGSGTVAARVTDSHSDHRNAFHFFSNDQTFRSMTHTVTSVAGNQVNRTVVIRIRSLAGYNVGSPGSVTFSIVDSGN